jgi:hypothetical protein
MPRIHSGATLRGGTVFRSGEQDIACFKIPGEFDRICVKELGTNALPRLSRFEMVLTRSSSQSRP